MIERYRLVGLSMRTILLLMLAHICGCTTMRTVDLGDALESLQIGDSIAVRTADTWHENLSLVSVTATSIQARNRSGELLTFAHSQIAEIRVSARAPGKAAALGFLIFVVTNSGFSG
jgi:hypothetical protein